MRVDVLVVSAVIAAASVVVPAVASAQSAPPGSGLPNPSVTMGYRQMRTLVERGQSDQINRARSRHGASQSAERRERAERLSAMANAGQCSEAVATARAEGDEEMARRLTDVCRAPAPTPAPAQ